MMIVLGREHSRDADPETELCSLLAAAAACEPAAGPFRLRGRMSRQFDATSPEELRIALALAVPSDLNARAGIPCRLFARSKTGHVFELSWPALPDVGDPSWNLVVWWPIAAAESAAKEIAAVLHVVSVFAEAFAPRFIEVGPASDSDSVLRSAWLVAQRDDVSPTLAETWHLARPAPAIAGLPSFTAHAGSPFSTEPADGEARRVLLRTARDLRDRIPVVPREAPPDEAALPLPSPPITARRDLPPLGTIALDGPPVRPRADIPASDALPFHPGEASPQRAIENAIAHAEAVQGPAIPANRAASGATVDLGAPPNMPSPFIARAPVPAAVPAPAAPPSSGDRTVALDGPPKGAAPLPFRDEPPRASPAEASPSTVAVPELTLEQYASLCVEIALGPDRVAHTLSRYRITAEQRAALDTRWRGRFAADPGLRAAFAQAFAAYRAMLTDPERQRGGR